MTHSNIEVYQGQLRPFLPILHSVFTDVTKDELDFYETDTLAGRAVASRDGDVYNGIGSYLSLGDSWEMKSVVKNRLNWGRGLVSPVACLFREWLEQYYDVIEEFDNDITRGNRQAEDTDILFNLFAVAPDSQGRRIGPRLITKSIDIATDLGANALYAQCWSGGRLGNILTTHFGFSPVIRIGPSYADDNSELFVARYLK